MAFHYKHFGSFGNNIKKYADRQGFVPEAGDKLEDFNFIKPMKFSNNEQWEQFIEEAATVSSSSLGELNDWQDEYE